MEGVYCTICRYDIDILGVTETGLPGEDFSRVQGALLVQLRSRGLVCIWGKATAVARNRGVMIVHRKGLMINVQFLA